MQRRRHALLLIPFALLACRAAPDGPPDAPDAPDALAQGPGAPVDGHAGAVGTAVVLERSFAVTRDEDGALPTHVPAVVFTPDGERLWIGSATGDVIEFDAATRAVRRRARFSEDAITAVSIDRDARLLCWLGGGALEVRRLDAPVDDGSASLGRVADVGDARALALSPAGDVAALGRADGVIEVRRLPDLEVAATIEAHAGAVTGLAFSPDGTRLASTGEDGKLVVSSANDLAALHTEKVSEPLYTACWTPDGGALLYGGHARVVDRLDTTSWTRERLLEGQPYYVTTLGVSPDGTRLALGDESCDVWIYDLASRARVFHSKHHVECWLSAVAWAPDSETFLFGCRPNTLADTPALYAQNRIVEALQDPAHQALLEQERAEVRALLASAERGELGDDAEERAQLVALLRQREGQLALPTVAPGAEELAGAGTGVLVFADADDDEADEDPELGLDLASQAAAPAPSVTGPCFPPDAAPATRAALEKLTALSAERTKVLQDNLQELSDGFQINVWRARR
jgi:hypothetical protein